VANSERFKNLKLSHFLVKEDKETCEQFGAYCVDIGLNHKACFFRPTNGSLYAWKENFKAAFQYSTCTQERASEYFNDVALRHPFQRFTLCGHSKGGNNAMYAGNKANWYNQQRIKQIINFDGPGFNNYINPGITNKSLLEKVTTIIPHGSVVGRLLDHNEKVVVVKGGEPNGIGQHDMDGWYVGENGFIREEKTNYKSNAVDKKIKQVMASLTLEEREQLVNGFFDVLYNTGYTQLDDVLKNPKTLFHGYFKTDKKERGVVRKVALKVLRDRKFMKILFGKKAKNISKYIEEGKEKSTSLENFNVNEDEMEQTMAF
jgi:hypothetical protein